MRSLGIDVENLQSSGFVGQREAQMWRLFRAHCIDLQEMFQQLTNAYTQVVALREAQASNTQAKSVRWLIILGTFYEPMSVVVGIMSTGEDFLPGAERVLDIFCCDGSYFVNHRLCSKNGEVVAERQVMGN